MHARLGPQRGILATLCIVVRPPVGQPAAGSIRGTTSTSRAGAGVPHETQQKSTSTAPPHVRCRARRGGRPGAAGACRPTASARRSVPRAHGLTPLDQARRFVVPPDFVPITTRIEIRPATTTLPYSAASRPELCAWVRLSDPLDDPLERLLVLADALAPSYAAVLTDLRPVPTIRMTARFTPQATTVDFDWVLLRAHTPEAGADGWLTETVTVWTPDGQPLASSSQLRTVR